MARRGVAGTVVAMRGYDTLPWPAELGDGSGRMATSSWVKDMAAGLILLVAAGSLLLVAWRISSPPDAVPALIGPAPEGFTITARFDNVGRLALHAPVTIGGVNIGRVTAIDYDSERYVAVVEMRIESRFDRIPLDSSASVYTAGLLGEQYIGLEPGGEDRYLMDRDELSLTQSALVLEQVVGQMIYNRAADDGTN